MGVTMVKLNIQDWLLFLLYASAIFFILSLLWRRKTDIDIRRKQKALLVKYLGVLLFVVLHIYLFKMGDTFSYFSTGVKLGNIIYTQPDEFLQLFTQAGPSTYALQHLITPDDILFVPTNYIIVKLVAVIAPIGLNSILTTTLLFGLFSFFATQSLIKVLETYTGIRYQLLDLTFVYIPTIMLWSSGICKDTITFGGICYLFAGFIRLFILHQKFLISSIWILLGYALCLNIKSYILYASLPFLLLFLWHQFYTRPYRRSFKIIGLTVNFTLIVVLIFYSQEVMSWGESNVLSVFEERFLGGAKGLSVSEAGSSYDLGIDYFSISGISELFQYAPRSIILSLFRPYPTDVRSTNMVLNMLESMALLGFFLFVFIRTRLFFFKCILQQPWVLFCILYSLTFSFFIGLASGNFGTLVRYKIPMMPFFILALIIIYREFQMQAQQKKKDVALG